MKFLFLTLLTLAGLILLAQAGENVTSTSDLVRSNNNNNNSISTREAATGAGQSDDNDDDDVDDDDDDDNDDEEDEELDEELEDEDLNELTTPTSRLLDHQVELRNRSVRVGANSARDLGLLTLKAILLGPLIGLTIKAALIRGLFWAVGAYLLHLFFPGVLSALGLGSGLVGFARQAVRPDLSQLLLPQLAQIPHSLPSSLNRLAAQYRQMFEPVVEAIRSIPEGHCRYRAVCETASQLIKNAQSLSNTLQRLSATVYMNLGTEYSKAWLDGIVQKDCAALYSQCTSSPFSMVASRLAEAIGPPRPQVAA